MGNTKPQPVLEDRSAATIPDALLVLAAQDDHAAFASLYDRYFDAIFRFCYYRLGNWQEAEDAVGDIFANALGGIGRYRAGDLPGSFRSWLFAIARNVIADRHRINARHPLDSLDLAAEMLDGAPTPEEAAVTSDNHQYLLCLLARLEPAQRDLLTLRLAGLRNVEIAHILGRSHDAVRKEQSRIVQALRLAAERDPDQEVPHG
jgi:RNA polymerase sigma-70 factor (ECF subfamily)